MDFVYCEILSTLSSANFPRLFVQRRECRRSVWNLLEAPRQLFSSTTIDTRERRKWLSCMWQEWAVSCNGSYTMTHLITAGHYLFIFAINATGFYFTSLSLLAISPRFSPRIFTPRRIFVTGNSGKNVCLSFSENFFSSEVLFRDRDKSKSAGDDSAASTRKKFLSYFARFTCGLDVLEILYAKLSTSIGSFSKLEFEKLHCMT